MLIDDPLGEGSNASFYRQRALEGLELIPQNERKHIRSDGSGMLIDDPLGEGSKASSTHEELWRAEKPFLRVRELKRPEGSGMLINDPLGEGSNASSTNKESDRSQSSGERRNHSSE